MSKLDLNRKTSLQHVEQVQNVERWMKEVFEQWLLEKVQKVRRDIRAGNDQVWVTAFTIDGEWFSYTLFLETHETRRGPDQLQLVARSLKPMADPHYQGRVPLAVGDCIRHIFGKMMKTILDLENLGPNLAVKKITGP